MARGKKKESALTPEEKLAQALVPVEEQPYQVPENWCWARIGAISDFERGITFPASAKENEPTEENIPCLRTANVQENLEIDDLIYVNQSFMKGNEAKLVRENDIIMSSANSRELVGKASFVTHVPFPMTFGGFVLIIRARGISSKYLFYFLRQEFLAGKFMGESTQTTNIANINTTTLGSYELPLPPLAEQQRIVDRIEYLFAKLDEAKEKAQSVLDSFETRKTAILRNAFRGEYTLGSSVENINSILSCMLSIKENMIRSKQIQRAKVKAWSEEDTIRVFPSEWKQVRVGEIAFVTKLAGFEYTKYIHLEGTGEVPVVRAQNVRMGYLSTENLLYIDNETSETLSRSALTKECILVTFIGAGIGDVCIFDQKCRFHLAPNVAKVEFFCGGNEELNTKYALYYLLSPYGQHEIFKNMKATAQPSLSMETIRDIIIPIPDKEEQAEIVRILDSLFAKEQQAKEAAEAVLEKIDLLKKSILARAFRGELGTNAPTEESAVELLKAIL